MPIMTGPIIPEGAVVDGSVGLSWPLLAALRRANRPIPSSRKLRWLIDSGASSTAVDPQLLNPLGLQPIRFQTTGVAAGSPLGLAAQYNISLTVVHPSNDPKLNLHLRDHPVLEMPLAALGYDGVIGRDILDRCLFQYNGPSSTFTLGY